MRKPVEGESATSLAEMSANPPEAASSLRRSARTVLIFFGALLFLFEEWLWKVFTRLFTWMGHHRAVRWAERHMSRTRPVVALTILCVPILVLFPIKIAGLWMIGTGHFLMGCATMIAAKVTSTAIVAKIFLTCRPQLLELRWFARLYAWLIVVREAVHAWIERQPAWDAARRSLRHLRTQLRAWTGRGSTSRATGHGDVRRGSLMRWRARRRGIRQRSIREAHDTKGR